MRNTNHAKTSRLYKLYSNITSVMINTAEISQRFNTLPSGSETSASAECFLHMRLRFNMFQPLTADCAFFSLKSTTVTLSSLIAFQACQSALRVNLNFFVEVLWKFLVEGKKFSFSFFAIAEYSDKRFHILTRRGKISSFDIVLHLTSFFSI